MKGDYPRFKDTYSEEELAEFFFLSQSERLFVDDCRSDTNRLVVAVLLKSLPYLGYFPELQDVPHQVLSFVAKQLDVYKRSASKYSWDGRTKKYHFAIIRKETGYRFPTAKDKEELESWLREDATTKCQTYEELFELALGRLLTLQIELPSEMELERLVSAALRGFLEQVYQTIHVRLPAETLKSLDQLIATTDGEPQSTLDRLKREPAQAGVDNMGKEIAKLEILKTFDLPVDLFEGIPTKLIETFARRARNERPSELRDHPDPIRHSHLASFVHVRTGKVVDDIIDMFIDLIHRMDFQSEQELDRQLLSDLKKVEGKVQMLFRIARAVVRKPDGTIRGVIFPEVEEETFKELVTEYEATGDRFRTLQQQLMRRKYVHHYQRMLPLVLEHLKFRSNNQYQPVIDALDLIKRYQNSDLEFFPEHEEVPIKGVVTPSWDKAVVHTVKRKKRVRRKMYELSVKKCWRKYSSNTRVTKQANKTGAN